MTQRHETGRPDRAPDLDGLDSTTISDALDSLSLASGTGALRSMWGSPTVRGRARTVGLAPIEEANHGAHIISGTVDAAGPGDVLVVANGGRTDVSCWGGILSLAARRKGVGGAIADGACRDVDEAREHSFPIYARAATPRTARGRLREVSAGQPVTIDGIDVHDGDYVLADSSGLVVIPAGHLTAVVEEAHRIRARESAIAAEVVAGSEVSASMHDSRLAGEHDPYEEGARR